MTANIPLKLKKKTMVKHVVFLQSMKDHTRTDIHNAGHGKTLARASFLSGTEAHGVPTVDKSVPEGLYTLEWTLSAETPTELLPMERTYVRELHVSCGEEIGVRQKVWQW